MIYFFISPLINAIAEKLYLQSGFSVNSIYEVIFFKIFNSF